jgi:hypothetical protein
MTYDPPKFGTKRRKRRVLYFNPPWNEAVATDIGRLFLRLICKHFPKGSKLHKYINLHNVKVSYSTTKNLKAHIASHNRKILRPEPEEDQRNCNCRSEKAKLSQLNRALKKPSMPSHLCGLMASALLMEIASLSLLFTLPV